MKTHATNYKDTFIEIADDCPSKNGEVNRLVKKVKVLLLAVITFLSFNSSFAQWTKINSIPKQEIVGLANLNNDLYAASDTNRIYKSIDSGSTWSEIIVSTEPIQIYTLKIIDEIIYIGTLHNGIFTSVNYGASWNNYSSRLPAISGFEKFNNQIYASTVGNGVHKYDAVNNNWIPFNNQLANNVAHNVETIVATSNKLLIGAGANGTYFYYDFISDQWILGYYYGTLIPGLIIQKIINHSDTLFAVEGQSIIRSNDGGVNWSDDKIGSHDGLSRNLFLGATNLYTITNLKTGGAWIQKRNKNAILGINWNTDEELFPIGHSFDIFEFKNRLYLATDDGLYVKDLALGIDDPDDLSNQVTVFPNPSKEGKIRVVSSVKIDNISINNILGQTIFTTAVLENNFEIQQNFEQGIYLITIDLADNKTLTKKIVIE